MRQRQQAGPISQEFSCRLDAIEPAVAGLAARRLSLFVA
jgi:hypothetical protein